MLRGLRALLVLIFVALLSHGPFSWGHTHRDLDPQQLHEHLETYHAGGPDTDLPSEWHYHLTWLQASHPCQLAGESGLEVNPRGDSVLQSIEWLCQANQTTSFDIGRWTEDALLWQPAPPRSALLAHSLRQREAYKLLGVLLI